jgi:hypothetical protein
MRNQKSIAIGRWVGLSAGLLALGVAQRESSAAAPTIAGCPGLPADNVWNQNVAAAEVDPRSRQYIAAMNGSSRKLKADFGSNRDYGIPWTVVNGSQPRVPVSFRYADESDPGPYPIPPDAPVENGRASNGDRHVLVLDMQSCLLYEMWKSVPQGNGWSAGSGAVFDLRSNALRPNGMTSADAAGLPILPGLVRREEVEAGHIDHALRFTVARTQRAYVAPATHFASSSKDPNLPPLGVRFRLRADFDISGFGRTAQVILTALKQYGMFLADNGQDWFLSGESNGTWSDEELRELTRVPASAFEALKPAGPLITK